MSYSANSNMYSIKFVLAFVALMLASGTMFAQQSLDTVQDASMQLPIQLSIQSPIKIGYIDRGAIVAMLPESIEAEKQINKQREDYELEYARMQQDYNEKIRHYLEHNKTMSDPIRLARQSDITEGEKRMVLFKQRYESYLTTMRSELYAPINARVDAAIKSAAEQAGIDVVLPADLPYYMSSRCIDLSGAVKALLGIELSAN